MITIEQIRQEFEKHTGIELQHVTGNDVGALFETIEELKKLLLQKEVEKSIEKLSGVSEKLDTVSRSVDACYSFVRDAKLSTKQAEECEKRSDSPTKSVLVRQITNLSS